MAIKRSMNVKKESIKRSIKRAPSEAITNVDDVATEVPPMDPAAAAADFVEAPLTPEQQAEKEGLEGSNAAASAANEALPERQGLANSAQSFKTSAAYAEFMALPKEERMKLIEEDQAEQKMKVKYSRKK